MKISVKTGDCRDFSVPLELAMASKTIANLLEDMAPGVATGGVPPDDVVPLPLVTARDMEHIIAYWNEPDRGVGDFAATLAIDDMWSLLGAANYLNIGPLFTGLTSYAAGLLTDKTPQEMRDVLGMPMDFTPEEEAQVMKECAWAFQ